MTDPERDHLLGRIADLERRLRGLRLACLVLLGLVLLPVVLGGLLGIWWVPRLERQRAAYLEAERERERLDYYQRIQEVENARLEAERQRAQAEEGARRQAQQEPPEDKH
jgi:hypothetical protein